MIYTSRALDMWNTKTYMQRSHNRMFYYRGVASPNCWGGARLGKFLGGASAPIARLPAQGVSEGGCAPLRSWKILEFLYWICAMWWILVGKIMSLLMFRPIFLLKQCLFPCLSSSLSLLFPSFSLSLNFLFFLPYSLFFVLLFSSLFPSLSFLSFLLFPFLSPFFPFPIFFSPSWLLVSRSSLPPCPPPIGYAPVLLWSFNTCMSCCVLHIWYCC